ncbi:radical SAM protein [Pseudodesulfovibrio sp. F-1]|uniref:Radical SAM protein n=1 Tax=Pseudodesulfovibrio alkaliphilus TaxID=2661613 RepID=A0A7K1KRF4_9BACT|nr:radical SAM protein [Pseudodesulfovibrio alkaliphilus]MUM78669.1 radical SAM protein [Pseudodesulfovibrio alkaliphilus]
MILPLVEVHAVDHCNQNCRWCHNYAPFAPKKEYNAEDYFPWLDLLRDKGAQFGVISIMGGEPMLHSDITSFAYKIYHRYKVPLLITTNGFWLSEKSIDAHQLLWKMLFRIKISRYPVIERKLHGYDRMKELSSRIKKHNPKIQIEFPIKSSFNKLEFYSSPREVEMYCGNSECTALLPNGIMGRCGAGAYTHLAPESTFSQGFIESKHMLYDLKQFNLRTFTLWKKRYPLDACSFCNFGFPADRSDNWKVEKNYTPFNHEYETDYFVNTASHFLHNNDIDGACDILENVDKKNKQRSDVLNIEGIIAFKRGAPQDALNLFREALDKNETFLEAASNYNYVVHSLRHS